MEPDLSSGVLVTRGFESHPMHITHHSYAYFFPFGNVSTNFTHGNETKFRQQGKNVIYAQNHRKSTWFRGCNPYVRIEIEN